MFKLFSFSKSSKRPAKLGTAIFQEEHIGKNMHRLNEKFSSLQEVKPGIPIALSLDLQVPVCNSIINGMWEKFILIS